MNFIEAFEQAKLGYGIRRKSWTEIKHRQHYFWTIEKETLYWRNSIEFVTATEITDNLLATDWELINPTGK